MTDEMKAMQETIADLQKQLGELKAQPQQKQATEEKKEPATEDKSKQPNANDFYDVAKAQIEQERKEQEREQEIKDLKEFELTFDKYLNDHKPFVSVEVIKAIDLIKNSQLTDGEKMRQIKSVLITDTFSIEENFNKLIDEDKQTINKFLSLKDDQKTKVADKDFTILKRYLANRKAVYTTEMIEKANRGKIAMTDSKFNTMSNLAKKSASKFLNVNEWEFRVTKK